MVPSHADRALRSHRGSCCPVRATDAYRALLRLGVNALPAVRAGLRHANPNVRVHCCRFLDRYLRPEMLSDLMDMLNDSDARVRCSALHTLACGRCKEGACRLQETRVLPQAMQLLARDPNAHVRAMAMERWNSLGNSSTATRLRWTRLLLRGLTNAVRCARRPDGMRRAARSIAAPRPRVGPPTSPERGLVSKATQRGSAMGAMGQLPAGLPGL